MITKGLSADTCEHIWTYIEQKGGEELIEQLQNDTELMRYEDASIGINEMSTLYQHCNAMGIADKV